MTAEKLALADIGPVEPARRRPFDNAGARGPGEAQAAHGQAFEQQRILAADLIQAFLERRAVRQAQRAREHGIVGAEIAKTDWRIALARAPHFAEYILYGVYADRVLGLDKARLFATEETLCLSRWTEGFDNADEETAFVAAIEPHHIACLVQSTIAMPIPARRALFERASAFAAQQDAGVTPES